jgi:hypothetical protein
MEVSPINQNIYSSEKRQIMYLIAEIEIIDMKVIEIEIAES